MNMRTLPKQHVSKVGTISQIRTHTKRQRSSSLIRFIFASMTILQFNDPATTNVVQALSVRAPVQRVVLVGGGHAHAQVLRALNKQSRPKNLQVTLIDAQTSASYSGMVPGCVSKLYKPEDTLLHLKPLCDWADIQFYHDEVVDVNLDERYVCLRHSKQRVPYDVVSVDIGSASRGLDETPGARENTIPTRPISDLVRRIDDAEKCLGTEAHVVVIGGGAAGVELSMSMVGRWRPILGDKLRVTVLDGGDKLLPHESDECRNKLDELLCKRGIEVLHNCDVSEITKEHVLLKSGIQMDYTHCIWATGAGAHPLAHKLKANGLAVNKRGWIQVDKNLQSISHPSIFAAGDCASMEGLPNGPPPKAGVYAVRSGPILIENLTGYLQSKPLKPYVPQDDFLKLLVCGDGTALGFRFGIPIYGKWVFRLKDKIDLMFMNLFKVENLPVLEDGAKFDTSQYDAIADKDRVPLDPAFAAEVIQREDDEVDFQLAWDVFRDMAKDASYRDQVLLYRTHQATVPVARQ